MIPDPDAIFQMLRDAGYEPDSVKAAIRDEDWTLLRHKGVIAVKLDPPAGEG